MTAINPSAIAMGIFGFVFLFGGLTLALRVAFSSGGYADNGEESEENA